MEKISILEFVKGLPFFEDFSEKEKSVLVNKEGIFEKYKSGETIIEEGAVESWLFVVLLGKIRLTKSSSADVKEGHISLKKPADIAIKELGAGSIFGEISLITNRPRNVTARAASEEVAVMKITKEILESFDHSIQIKFKKQFILNLAENLDDMNTQYVKLVSNAQKS